VQSDLCEKNELRAQLASSESKRAVEKQAREIAEEALRLVITDEVCPEKFGDPCIDESAAPCWECTVLLAYCLAEAAAMGEEVSES